MAKLIFNIHSRVQFAIKKGLTGYISPSRIDEEVHAAQMDVWKKYIDDYAKTQKISLFLKPFERVENVTGLAGTIEGTKVVQYCHKYPIAIITVGGKVVQKLTISEYGDAFNNVNKPPTSNYPISKFVNNVIYVAPNLDVNVTYIATPTKPLYAFTLSGDDYVYDDANSVDIEFDEVLHNDIMSRSLANIGISMRDLDVYGFSQKQKTDEGK